MGRLAEQIKAILRSREQRRSHRLSADQSRVLRRNLKALLHSKEAIAERGETAA